MVTRKKKTLNARARPAGSSKAEGAQVVPIGEPLNALPTIKSFTFLEAIAQSERPLSISEISALLSVPQPTAHRIMRMLEDERLLAREPGTRRFGPGDRLLRLSLGLLSTAVRSAPRRAILEELSKTVGETCNFGVMVGNHLMYLDRIEAAWPFGLRFEPGSRVPLHCTSMGKLFLAFLAPEHRRRLLTSSPLHHYTEKTITDPLRLERELERIRTTEISTDDQEFLAGVVCVAVPIRAPGNTVAAALAISAPVARMSLNRALQHVPELRRAASRIETTLAEQKHAAGQAPRTSMRSKRAG
jgi:IclR family acetate operon transcriptional repressor